MTINTGAGGGVGGPPTLTPRELEASAATEVAKLMMGIMSADEIKPFSQVDTDAAWKYKSSPENPLLPPLNRLRIALAQTLVTDTTWTQELDRLINLLPADVKAQLLIESQLPIEERDPAYGALDAVLGIAAKVIAWANSAAVSGASEIGASRLELNLILPEFLRKSLNIQATAFLEASQNYLALVGHNNVNYDRLQQTVGDINELLTDFTNLTTGTLDKGGLSELAADMDKLYTQTLSTGNDLQGLRPLLWTMSIITATAALNTAASPSLLWGLSIADIGFAKK